MKMYYTNIVGDSKEFGMHSNLWNNRFRIKTYLCALENIKNILQFKGVKISAVE